MQVKQVTWVELALVCKTWCLGVSGRVPGLSWACVAAGAAPAAGGKVCAGVLRQAAGGRWQVRGDGSGGGFSVLSQTWAMSGAFCERMVCLLLERFRIELSR